MNVFTGEILPHQRGQCRSRHRRPRTSQPRAAASRDRSGGVDRQAQDDPGAERRAEEVKAGSVGGRGEAEE